MAWTIVEVRGGVADSTSSDDLVELHVDWDGIGAAWADAEDVLDRLDGMSEALPPADYDRINETIEEIWPGEYAARSRAKRQGDGPRKIELPVSITGAIEAIATSTMPAGKRYEAILLIVIGYGLYHSLDTYDPRSIAIPSQQWQDICALLAGMSEDGITAVNFGLDWVNQGPSGYEP